MTKPLDPEPWIDGRDNRLNLKAGTYAAGYFMNVRFEPREDYEQNPDAYGL